MVLVFITNDFFDNYLLLQAMFFGLDPKHYPFVGCKRKSQRAIYLFHPAADFRAHQILRLASARWVFPLGYFGVPRDSFLNDLWNRSLSRAARDSDFVAWLGRLGLRYRTPNHERVREAYMNFLGVYRHLLDDWEHILDWASKGVAFGGI